MAKATRVKVVCKTVGTTLSQSLVKTARKRNLNMSRVTEQALNSIIDYLETQNKTESSKFLNSRSFVKESEWARSSARPERRTLNPLVAGSTPVGPAIVD